MRSSILRKKTKTIWLGLLTLLAGSLLSGCQLYLHGNQSTFSTRGPVAESQLDVFYVTLAVTVFIFIAVGGALAYATLKFRSRHDESQANEPPQQSHGNPVIEIGLIVASIVLLVFIAVPTVRGIWFTFDVPENGGPPLEIDAVGYQWWFHFEYPESGVVTANELIVPVDRPIRINLRTSDVIHSFWIPKLAGKVDMIPNRGNHMWLQSDVVGYFWGQCAEFCGESHANMRFRAVVLPQQEFDVWIEHQKETARTAASGQPPTQRVQVAMPSLEMPAVGLENQAAFQEWLELQQPDPAENIAQISRGRELFVSKACISCHKVRGHHEGPLRGPDLTHFGARTTLAAGLLANTPENVLRWLKDPESVKPGNLMYRDGYVPLQITLTDEEAQALTAYLRSLK